jgi:hypothetical protein
MTETFEQLNTELDTMQTIIVDIYVFSLSNKAAVYQMQDLRFPKQ